MKLRRLKRHTSNSAKAVLTSGLIMALATASISAPPVIAAESYGNSSGKSSSTTSNHSAATYTKDENVYGTLAANGSTENLYVVNQFDISKAGTITDYGTYDSIENLTDTTSIPSVNGKQTFFANAGSYYYQGDLHQGQLPWNITIKYELDGKEVAPESLAGATGHVKIHIKTSQNKKVKDLFFKKYMLQVSFSVPASSCKNIDTKNLGTVSDAGDKRQITYTVMPKKNGDLVFETDATAFEMGAISIAGAPFSMSMDDFDTDKLTSGMASLADGVSSLNGGVQSVADGVNQLSSASSKLTNAGSQVSEGLSTLASGTSGISSSSAQFAKGLSSLSDTSSQLTNASSSATSEARATVAALNSIDTSAMSDAQKDAISKAKSQASATLSAANESESKSESFATDITKVSSQYQSLNSGISSLSSGISKLSLGTNSYVKGVDSYASGVSQLANGTKKLADGSNTLASNTADLPSQMQKGIDEAMASYSGDFDPKSYIDTNNDHIRKVQFALSTKAIEIPDRKTPTEDSEANMSIIDRIIALFKH